MADHFTGVWHVGDLSKPTYSGERWRDDVRYSACCSGQGKNLQAIKAVMWALLLRAYRP